MLLHRVLAAFLMSALIVCDDLIDVASSYANVEASTGIHSANHGGYTDQSYGPLMYFFAVCGASLSAFIVFTVRLVIVDARRPDPSAYRMGEMAAMALSVLAMSAMVGVMLAM